MPRKFLSTAIAIGALNFNLARFVGPALAGPIIVFADIGVAFAVNCATYIGFLVALHFIEVPPNPARSQKFGRDRGLLADTVDGLSYVARHKGIGPFLLILFVGGTALRPLIELLAGYADMVHARGEVGFAILTAAMGGGAFLISAWLALQGSRIDHLRTIYLSGIVGGAVILLLALLPSFTAAVVAVTVAAGAITLNGVAGQITLQLTVPDAMRGRVLSLFTAIFRGTPALGAILIGATADQIGFRMPLAIAGIISIAVFAGAALWARPLKQHLGPAATED